MDTNTLNDIIACEEQLQLAMQTSNTALLDQLISAELLFTNHLGHSITKAQDLAAHESGQLKIQSLITSEQKIIARANVVIVSVRADIKGTYAGQPANGNFRFTRVWEKNAHQQWQIIAGHSSMISDI